MNRGELDEREETYGVWDPLTNAWVYCLIEGWASTSMNTVMWLLWLDRTKFTCISLVGRDVNGRYSALGKVKPEDVQFGTCISFFGEETRLPVLRNTKWCVVVEGGSEDQYPGNIVFTTRPRVDIRLIHIYPVQQECPHGFLFFNETSFVFKSSDGNIDAFWWRLKTDGSPTSMDQLERSVYREAEAGSMAEQTNSSNQQYFLQLYHFLTKKVYSL